MAHLHSSYTHGKHSEITEWLTEGPSLGCIWQEDGSREGARGVGGEGCPKRSPPEGKDGSKRFLAAKCYVTTGVLQLEWKCQSSALCAAGMAMKTA